jgi:hypothetical protein
MSETSLANAPDNPTGSLIRWHYLCYAAIALGVMAAVIASRNAWLLNFVHVFCGLLWTGIDLFMGFILGPILRVVDLSARKAVLLRLTPRTLFLMPTLSVITGTTGWYMAEYLGLGYLLPVNLRVCLELQKANADHAKIAALTNHYFLAVALQGAMQVVTIFVMARFATGI